MTFLHRILAPYAVPGRHLLLAGALLALLASGGCASISYYWQAGMGQWEIIANRRPIDDVLADDSVDAETKAKLRLVEEVQTFATQSLALPEEGHYHYYTNLGRNTVSWLVVASEPLALESYTFCYPLVGCMGYKGFFARADAQALAHRLSGEGYDTLVRPVQAYSTLGWFDDPVLNTFLSNDAVVLVGTIIHEQAHRRYYLKGDTTFNESFAMCVEEEGVRRFALARQDTHPELLARYEAYREDTERFHRIVLHGRERLAALYGTDLPDAEKRVQKARIFDGMREDYQNQRGSFKLLNYDAWFAQPLNNANLIGVGQYHQYLAAFRTLLEESQYDFARFFAAVEALGRLPQAEREARLHQLEAKRFVAATRHSQR